MSKAKRTDKHTHVAIVYQDGKFIYYRNGKKIKPKKNFTIDWWEEKV